MDCAQEVVTMLVVEKKVVVNLSMPESIHKVYESLASDVGGNSKWTVISAAMVAFHELTSDMQRAYVGRVRAADGDQDGMAQLLADAKEGELRKLIDAEVQRRNRNRSAVAGTIGIADEHEKVANKDRVHIRKRPPESPKK